MPPDIVLADVFCELSADGGVEVVLYLSRLLSSAMRRDGVGREVVRGEIESVTAAYLVAAAQTQELVVGGGAADATPT